MSRPNRLISFAGYDPTELGLDGTRPPPKVTRRPFHIILREKIARGQRKGLTLREIAEKHRVPLELVQFEAMAMLDEGRP